MSLSREAPEGDGAIRGGGQQCVSGVPAQVSSGYCEVVFAERWQT